MAATQAIDFWNKAVKSHLRMVINAGSLLATMGLNAGLGFAYWWIAAHYYSVVEVGIASTAISAMLLLAELGILGFRTYLLGEIPRQVSRAPSMILTAVIIVFVSGGLLGLAFALLAPYLSEELAILSQNIGFALLFALGVSLTTVAFVVDYSTIGLNRGELQLWRNLFFALLKLVLLLLSALLWANDNGLIIYATWALAGVISLSLAPILALKSGVSWQAMKPEWSLLRELKGSALAHHGLNLAIMGPNMLLPILVTVLISASATASFYIAWMLTSFILFVPTSFSTSLYAAASREPETFASRMRVSLLLSFTVVFAANILLAFLAHPILLIFGEAYAVEGEYILRLLAAAAIPYTIVIHYVAVARVLKVVARGAIMMLFSGIFQVIGMSIGAKIGGTILLSLSFIITFTIIAIPITPIVYRVATGKIRN